MAKIKVTIYNEFMHEKQEPIRSIYPQGIHGAIAQKLGDTDYIIRTATLENHRTALSKEVLDDTDVLIWWGHMHHQDVCDEVVNDVVEHVNNGMGLICLHSAHMSKPFMKLMGTTCNLKWREEDERERIWVVEPGHPIAAGLPEYIEMPEEETYGERFDIPAPDKIVFMSWFEGGEVFRSGCCFERGAGKIFYFRPGHEAYPTFYRDDVTKIIKNAIEWAKPSGGPVPTMGNYKALEKKLPHEK